MGRLLWEPSPERASSSQLVKFMKHVGVGDADVRLDYDRLWKYSIEQPDAFWSSVWDFCDVVGDRGSTACSEAGGIRDVRFFPGARLNYAENLFRRMGAARAVTFHSEGGEIRSLSWDELRSLTSRIQQALADAGVSEGDRVAAIVSNTPETVAAMLAVASIGAVWSSCSPDFGVNGVMDRFGQIAPKLMFCHGAYEYGGKRFRSLPTAVEVAKRMDETPRIVVLPYAPGVDEPAQGIESLAEFVDGYQPRELEFRRVDFRSPLFIMFSSGTTGLPKCIVHSVGGSLLQHLKEHRLQCDIRPDDRLMYVTTCGWMMWNWMVSALASEASIVLYDGSPLHPDGWRLPGIAETERLTQFGSSAKYFEACSKADVAPAGRWPLSDLKSVFSTGSPLSPESFDYIYSKWKADICLASIAGGTDILGCFVGGSPVSPVYRGECQKRYLGMDVRVYDPAGNALVDEPGELVCASAHPSMPTGFYNDPGGEKYESAYFARFPGVWHHGDWVRLTKSGGLVFYGRSDATLNPGGVRIGTAEIYRPVERLPQVLESLAIGLGRGADVEIVLFVRLREGIELSDRLVGEIRSAIRTGASPRHVPSKIFAVTDIPRTKSGKIVELAVRNVVNGRPVENIEALANPEALEQFKSLPGLAGAAGSNDGELDGPGSDGPGDGPDM